MKKISVLDCTLRDGGYCNQWKFGKHNITRIINGLVEADIDIVECGFLTKKLEYDVYDEDMKELTSNVGVVMVKDNQFKIGVNCRIPLNEHIQVVEEKVAEKTKEFGYAYKVLGARNRHYVDPNGKLVQTLLSVYQEVTGDYENKPFTIGGGTYAREIGNAVAYGPVFVGREDVCHIADEYMILEDFYKAIEVYVKAIYELSK